MAVGMFVRDPVTGTWRGRVDLQRDPTGRRRQVRVHGRTKAECEAKVRKALEEDHRGLIPAKGRNAYTVSDAADAWLATKRGRSSRTIDSYQGEINRHIRPLLGRLLVTALRRSDVEHAIARWETTPRQFKRGGVRSSTSVRYYITLLFGIIELAKDDGYRPDNPVAKARRPKIVRPEKPATDAAGAAHILAAVRGTPLFRPLLLALTQGVRPGELIAITRGATDVHARKVRICRAVSYRGKRLEIKVPKSAKSIRTLYLCDELAAELADHLEDQEQRFEALGIQVSENTPLFDRGDGELWHPDSFRDAFQKCLKQHGLPPFQWRGTRHTFSTMAELDHGASSTVIRDILGHENEATHRVHYTKYREDPEACRQINAQLTRDLLGRISR